MAQESRPTKEYQVKAVFLFNFIQFVAWPSEAFADDSSPFIIGILGQDPFGEVLDETVKGESVNGRPIKINRCREPSEIGQCHMLFIASSEEDQLPQLLEQLHGRAVLTIGDTDDFAHLGGMIRLAIVSGKTRIAINLESARAAELHINPKLLRLSEIVSSKKS